MSRTWRWAAPVLAGLAVLCAAVLAIVTNIATTLVPETWPAAKNPVLMWSLVAGLVVVAGALAIWSAHAARIESGEEEYKRARAVELMLTRDGDRTNLAVLNKDRYEVTRIRIECWPLGANPPPPFELASAPGHQVSYKVITGGGQLIEVPDLEPLPNPDTGTGISLGSWVLGHGTPTGMKFQVDWLDHQRRGRRLVGVGDLDDFAVIAWVKLEPPEPLITPASWWGRLKHWTVHR